MKTIILAIICAVFLTTVSPAMAQPSLTLGTAVASSTTVSFPIILSGAAAGPLSSLSGSIIFNPQIFAVRTNSFGPISASAGPVVVQAGKNLNQAASYNSLSFAVLSFGNTTPLADGQVATVTFDIVSSAGKTGEQFRLYNISASDPDGSQVTVDAFNTMAPSVAQLSLNLSGNGSGNVNSLPPGLACTKGICSTSFYVGSTVTLIATPSAGSEFSGWSGNCAGQSCSLAMTADRTAGASFAIAKRVKIGTTYFGTLGTAAAAAADRSTLQTRDVSFIENIVFDRPIATTLAGGYGADFSSRTGYTTIDGSLAIRAGKVAVELIKLR